jgi:acetyl esterase/lipase
MSIDQNAKAPTPVVVDIHGGGWVAGSKEGEIFSNLFYRK